MKRTKDPSNRQTNRWPVSYAPFVAHVHERVGAAGRSVPPVAQQAAGGSISGSTIKLLGSAKPNPFWGGKDEHYFSMVRASGTVSNQLVDLAFHIKGLAALPRRRARNSAVAIADSIDVDSQHTTHEWRPGGPVTASQISRGE
jgi:hypothetical protein